VPPSERPCHRISGDSNGRFHSCILEWLVQFLTVLSCCVFAGAAMYITLVEHPAQMECTTELAATEFRPSYRRAAVMQASLAALGFARSRLGLPNTTGVGFLGGSSGGSYSLYAFGRAADQHAVAGSVA
jgi:hypothetical protein